MESTWANSLLFAVGFLLMLVSLAANVLVVFALTFKKRTRIPAFNILMLGQTVICLVDVFFNMPLTTAAAYMNNWPLDISTAGLHLCRFHSFFNSAVQTCRIVLISLMALDRMIAVFSPINYPDRVTRERAFCMTIYCWLHASAVYISMLAGATPVRYRRNHFSCLIAASAPDSYLTVMITFGYIIPVLFTCVFLTMILKKYIDQEPMVRVVEDATIYPQGDSSPDRPVYKKRLKSKSPRSMSDFEVAAYVAFLFLVWLLCQSPLFVTLISDIVLTDPSSLPTASAVIGNSTIGYNSSTFGNLSIPVTVQAISKNSNTTTNATTIVDDEAKYEEMFPREFQTIVQFLNFVPTLLTPVLTFSLYRTVWSRLRHVIAKSRFARRRHRAFSIDEDTSANETTIRSRAFIQATTVHRSRQRARHRNRLAAESNPSIPDTSIASNMTAEEAPEKEDSQRPPNRMGTPVLMATADGLLLHQIIRNRPAMISPGSDGDVFVVDENGYFGANQGGGESDVDNPQTESDAMTSSCNSTNHLLTNAHEVVPMDTIKGSIQTIDNDGIILGGNGDSGIEDSPSSKLKASGEPTSPTSIAFESKLSVESAHRSGTTMLVSPASASTVRPMLAQGEPSFHLVEAQRKDYFPENSSLPEAYRTELPGLVAKMEERARNTVNATVRRILGNTSPKTKYRANSVFTVPSLGANTNESSLMQVSQTGLQRERSATSHDLLQKSNAVEPSGSNSNRSPRSQIRTTAAVSPSHTSSQINLNADQRY